ncbi:MAG: hypothetical protein GY814_15960 [Gammaproteobacteria bacterium]|nr:hypothetical protein [Gammaproteobacteria bacterium]
MTMLGIGLVVPKAVASLLGQALPKAVASLLGQALPKAVASLLGQAFTVRCLEFMPDIAITKNCQTIF